MASPHRPLLLGVVEGMVFFFFFLLAKLSYRSLFCLCLKWVIPCRVDMSAGQVMNMELFSAGSESLMFHSPALLPGELCQASYYSSLFFSS